MNPPSILQPIATIIQALATLAVGAGVIFFASLQWKVARDKLRLDLFDRRYKVYEAARKFLTSAVNKPNFDFSDLIEFNRDTSDAEFLFRADVVEYLKEIRSQVNKMDTFRKTSGHLQARDFLGKLDEIKRNANVESDELMWLINQFTEITKIFAPYLSYSNIKDDSALAGITAQFARIDAVLRFDERKDK